MGSSSNSVWVGVVGAALVIAACIAPAGAAPGTVVATVGPMSILQDELDRRAAEMEQAPPAEAGASAPAQKRIQVKIEAPSVTSEINVIGCTGEEARERVDKFLDTAVLASIPRVRVVHGHGKGVLRRTLAEMFATHPHVQRHYPAEQREGGTGATIVELRV